MRAHFIGMGRALSAHVITSSRDIGAIVTLLAHTFRFRSGAIGESGAVPTAGLARIERRPLHGRPIGVGAFAARERLAGVAPAGRRDSRGTRPVMLRLVRLPYVPSSQTIAAADPASQ